MFAKYILYIFLDINVRRRAVIIFMPNSPVDCHCGWTLIVESYISVYCYSGHIQSHIIFQSISFCIDFCRQQQQKPGQRTPEKLNLCFGPKNMPHVACAIENSWFSSNPLTRSTTTFDRWTQLGCLDSRPFGQPFSSWIHPGVREMVWWRGGIETFSGHH